MKNLHLNSSLLKTLMKNLLLLKPLSKNLLVCEPGLKIYLLQYARYQNNVEYEEDFSLPTFLSAHGDQTQRC